MKKSLFLCAITALLLCACAQRQGLSQTEAASVPASHIDVEQLNQPFDLDMDISALPLSDLRVLRNAFAARVGYPFRDAYLRGIYQTTTWYDSLMWNFDDTRENFNERPYDPNESYRDGYYLAIKDSAVPLQPDELRFIERVSQREAELQKHNFDTPEGLRVNMSNLVNPAQLVTFDPQLQLRLAQNGFAIVPTQHAQLFHVYEQNDYANFPNFVTTDLFLQLFHLYFDCMLRELEEQKLVHLTAQLVNDMHINIRYLWATTQDEQLKALARHDDQYLAIAQHLLTGKPLNDIDEKGTAIEAEIGRVMAAEDSPSDFIGDYNAVKFGYSLFRPRGHYTRSEELGRYFRAMMWLQSVPFGLDSNEQTAQALILADDLARHPQNRTTYEQLNQVLTFLMGSPDNLSLLQVADVLQADGRKASDIIATPGEVEKMRLKLNRMAEQQTRLRPRHQHTSRNKVCLLPQRYQPDAEVLQEMVDYDSEPTLRPVPSGLDVFAAMGNATAQQLLHPAEQPWKDFQPTLDRMRGRMDSTQWDETIAKRWLKTLTTLSQQPEHAPYFMVTPEWQAKSLNAALSAWAQLKHDAILYAKQPMGAECGGGGPPEPVVRGYVEPNTAFWTQAISLLDATEQLLERLQLLTPKVQQSTARLREEAELLLRLSQKELQGVVLADEEYDQLEYIGARFENMSLDLVRQPDQYLMGWDDVQGPDRNVALVADVYTANADNNPHHSVLYAAVGQADELYVVVQVEGCLYLMRGAVLSYREFTRPTSEQRLTDEQWQQMLQQQPRLGVPEWMQPVIVPLEKAPVANEEFFYSTGC